MVGTICVSGPTRKQPRVVVFMYGTSFLYSNILCTYSYTTCGGETKGRRGNRRMEEEDTRKMQKENGMSCFQCRMATNLFLLCLVWSACFLVCFEFRMSTCFQATGDLISPHFPIFNIYICIYTCCSFFFFFFTLFSYMINTILDIYYKFILLNCRILLVLQLNPYLFVL